jgi:L-amino acid N-acyltransferase YncA
MTSDTDLRVATPDDATAIAAIYAPYVRDTTISFELEPPSAASMRARIEGVVARHTWLVACAGGVVTGYAYASEHRSRAAYRWSVDVAVYLEEGARRRGLGGRLYRALFALLAHAGYVNAYAGIALPNAASVALHEKLGFESVGIYRGVGFKNGAWRDVGWWGRDLAARASDPAPPRPVRDLGADVVARALAEA